MHTARNKPVSNYWFRKLLQRRTLAILEPIPQRTLLLPAILFQMRFEIALQAFNVGTSEFFLFCFDNREGFFLHKFIIIVTA